VSDTLVRIALVFGALSALGFGGGKGIVPQMHAEVVDHFHWVTSEQFAQFYTIGKLMPGPSTIFGALVGFRAAGFAGAAVATAALFVPSSLIVLLAGRAWRRFSNSPWKTVISAGLAPVVIGLVWASTATIARSAVHDVAELSIALLVTAFTLRSTLGAPLLIGLGAAGGLLFLR
jgi:chromate transporter